LFVDIIQNWKKIKCPVIQLLFLVATVLFNFALGLLPGIDNFAHLGGFVQGIIGAIIFLPRLGKKMVRSGIPRWILAVVFIPIDILLFVGALLGFYLGVQGNQWCTFCTWISCLPIADWCPQGSKP